MCACKFLYKLDPYKDRVLIVSDELDMSCSVATVLSHKYSTLVCYESLVFSCSLLCVTLSFLGRGGTVSSPPALSILMQLKLITGVCCFVVVTLARRFTLWGLHLF